MSTAEEIYKALANEAALTAAAVDDLKALFDIDVPKYRAQYYEAQRKYAKSYAKFVDIAKPGSWILEPQNKPEYPLNLAEVALDLPLLNPDMDIGTRGFDENGALAMLIEVMMPKTDSTGKIVFDDGKPVMVGSGKKITRWLTDCVCWIDKVTRANNKTEVQFGGWGARDQKPHNFKLDAVDLADSRKFRASVINAFGPENKIGGGDEDGPFKLAYEVVQDLTLEYGHMRSIDRIEFPCWYNNVPLIPGMDEGLEIEFKLSHNLISDDVPPTSTIPHAVGRI